MAVCQGRTACRCLSAGTLSVLLCACGSGSAGPRPHPIRGSVRINGQPARGAEVSFQFLGDARGHTINPTGRCGDDGGFDLTTFAAHDGAPAGDYEVSITWPAWHRGLKNVGPDRLQGHLADPKKTGLRAHVEPGQTALPPFDLTAEVLPAVAGRVDDTRSNKERRNTR